MEQASSLVPRDRSSFKREAKKTNDSTFDRIWKYYHNSKTRIQLEPWEDDIRVRWEAAWYMLCGSKTMKAIADYLEITYHISKSVAYDDVRNAMNLFGGDPRKNFKEAKRSIAETMILRTLEKLEAAGDWELHERYLQKYIDINGLKDNKGTDTKLEDLIGKMKPQQIIIVSSQAELEKQATELQMEITREVEFEEIKKHEGEITEG